MENNNMTWYIGLDKDSPAFKFANDESKSIRVVAGPGTGKSFGLRRRVAKLLEQGVDPKRILTVTFTRTAAQDLKSELSEIGVEGAENVVAKTLHSFCFAMLNSKSIIQSTGRYPRPMLEHELNPMLYDLSDEFGGKKDKEKILKAFEAVWARLQNETPNCQSSEMDKKFEQEIMLWLSKHQSMLFGEMIRESYKYLHHNPHCNERKMFDHVLVDEYQDLNKAEQSVIDYLAINGNIAVIGDDDQSIYSFKHAHPDGIREFTQTHTPCNSIDFEQCRRCPTQVVNMASKLISNNTNRTLGDLKPFDNNANGIIKIVQFNNLDNEIRGITNAIKKQITDGKIQPQDVLVLVPVRKIGYKVRTALVSMDVNAKSYFRETALRSDKAKKILAQINILANPNDLVAWRYLLGAGSADFSKTSYRKIYDYAIKNNMDTITVLEKIASGEITCINHINQFVGKFKITKDELLQFKTRYNLDRSSLRDIIDNDDEENSDFRNIILSTIDEIGLMEDEDINKWFEKLYSSIVECVSYPQEIKEQDHVRIMSLHASKGLSAKFVVVMSCIDELLPRIDHDMMAGEIQLNIEEQRRLFYVAVTRCKCTSDYNGTLIISSFSNIMGSEALQIGLKINRRPFDNISVKASRFIAEFGETAPDTIAI